jgi:hypothetical protein
MPGNPRAIIGEAERQFPIRIAIKVPEAGIGALPAYNRMARRKLRYRRLVYRARRNTRHRQ